MKVKTRSTVPPPIKFSDLALGDVFRFDNGQPDDTRGALFMRITTVSDEKGNPRANCTSLNGNFVTMIGNDRDVWKVDGEFVES
jgi:hypothetical protein